MYDKLLRCMAALGCCAAAALAGCTSAAGAVPEMVRPSETLNFERFEGVHVYHSHGKTRRVVLFLSGDDGWAPGVVTMAQRLAERGVMVAGIDTRAYFTKLEAAGEQCVAPSSDFENLSHYLQTRAGLKSYLTPTLVGFSSGATLAYATLDEAPEGLFTGALTVGFCPDLDLKKPICLGAGTEGTPHLDPKGAVLGVIVRPARDLSGKWIDLQGERDAVCPAPPAKKFVTAVPSAEYVQLPRVGHELKDEMTWMPQFESAFARASAFTVEAKSAALAAAVADLPLHIVPAAAGGTSDWFGIFLTGDGGWVALDKGVSQELAKRHIPVVGWDSLKYFWSKRTPEGAAQDLDRVVKFYAHAWGKSRVLLIGYSQGADTMPFMVNRLPPATRDMVGFTTLLGISDNAVFEFHVANWLGNPTGGLPTGPELERWAGSPYLCLYGENDPDSACQQLTGHDGSALKMAGSHHFANAYGAIAREILTRMPGG